MDHYDFDGAGDVEEYESRSARVIPSYVKRKLSNGLRVPVFPRVLDENGNSDNGPFRINASKRESGTPSAPKRLTEKKSFPEVIKEYLSCPLCKDPVIEATSTSCGHKFCKVCLDKWRKEKSVCPICSTLIAYTHRVYSDDQMIESQLENFSFDVQSRFLSAQKKRIDTLLEERKSQTVFKRICRTWDESLTYFRSKSWKALQAEVISNLKQFWKFMGEVTNNYYFGLFSAFLLGVILTLVVNQVQQSNFVKYALLAVQKYNGTVPNWEPNSGVMDEEALSESAEQSWIEMFISFPYMP